MHLNNKKKPTYHASLEILNSEGPILQAVKLNNYFVMVDEDHEQVDVLTPAEMIRFTEGSRSVQDSRGRVWNYNKVDTGMKVEKDKLLSFIGLFYEIDIERLLDKYATQFEHDHSDFEVIRKAVRVLENNPSLIFTT